MNNPQELKNIVLPILKPYAKTISIIGSFARGEENSESDLDILVTLKSPEERPPLGLKWFDLEDSLSKLIGRTVELITEQGISPHIRPYIEQDKVILYAEG